MSPWQHAHNGNVNILMSVSSYLLSKFNVSACNICQLALNSKYSGGWWKLWIVFGHKAKYWKHFLDLMTKAIRIHPLGSMNVCTKCQANPSSRCWDISLGCHATWQVRNYQIFDLFSGDHECRQNFMAFVIYQVVCQAFYFLSDGPLVICLTSAVELEWRPSVGSFVLTHFMVTLVTRLPLFIFS